MSLVLINPYSVAAPATIPVDAGLFNWLEAEDAVAGTSTWADRSSNGYDWTWDNSNNYSKPANNQVLWASNNIIRAPSGVYPNCASGGTNGEAELFCRLRAAGTSRGIWQFSNKNDNGDWYPYGTATDVYIGWGSNLRPYISVSSATTSWHTLNVTISGGTWRVFYNGSLENTQTGRTCNFINQPYIGKMGAAGFYWNGYISSLVVYDRALSDAERATMAAWMDGRELS